MHRSDFLKYLKYQKKYSEHTINSYACDLNQFYEFCFQDDFVSENAEDFEKNVSHKIIRLWIAKLSDDEISARTINRKLTSLKSFFKYLEREKIVNKNPTNKLIRPKIKKQLPDFINEDDIYKLLSADIFKKDFDGYRNRLVIELIYSTGIRRAELINLKLQDIDKNKNTIKVLGKRNKERIIPYPKSINILIDKFIDIRNENKFQSEYFFLTKKGKKMYPKLVYNIVNNHLAYISVKSKRSPHVLRHSFATHMLNNGADINAIKELLGHSSLSATQVYTHNTFKKLSKAYKQAHPRA